MAKTATIVGGGELYFTCAQCGKKVSDVAGKLLQVGLFGVRGTFCCNGCAAAYARDHGWTLK